MPIFITLSLILGILANMQSPFQELFKAIEMQYLGIGLVVIAALLAYLRKSSLLWPFDLFATATLLIWFYRWHHFYRDDAPMFFIFPLFFAIVTSVVTLSFVYKRDLFDEESIEAFQFFSKMLIFNCKIIVTALLISLFLTHHFIVYPVMMMVFIFRYVLSVCLEPQTQ